MSTITNLKLNEPVIYHREYEHDLGKTNSKSTTTFDQCLRGAKTALPFITLHKPFAKPVSIILGRKVYDNNV